MKNCIIRCIAANNIHAHHILQSAHINVLKAIDYDSASYKFDYATQVNIHKPSLLAK